MSFVICSICLDKSLTTNMVDTSCNHYFHIQCYNNYIFSCVESGIKVMCPMCRSDPFRYADEDVRRCQIVQQYLFKDLLEEFRKKNKNA